MNNSSTKLFRKDIFNFLQTLTIKFEYFSRKYNADLQYNYTIYDDDEFKNKYYMNLQGKYHESDVLMTIWSLDEKKMVNFTTEMLRNSPKTRAMYVAGSYKYDELCAQYPTQTDLIKNIVYPIDKETISTAQDFTILGYDSSMLEAQEAEIIIRRVSEFLDYYSSRWYFREFINESYYPIVVWTTLWQLLPILICALRFDNIRTSYVHSFHVWEYLASVGLDDYRDILTPAQARFLYRNMNYLDDNKGKQKTLEILADNILGDRGIGLSATTIHQEVEKYSDEYRWSPEFVAEAVVDEATLFVTGEPENMTDLNYRMYTEGLTDKHSFEYVKEQETKIGTTDHNRLPTKLLEIKRIPVDDKYMDLLQRFMLENLFYRIGNNLYETTIDFVDAISGQRIKLIAEDALIMLHYVLAKQQGFTPKKIPNKIITHTLLPDEKPIASLMDTTFYVHGDPYKASDFINIDNILDQLVFIPTTIYDKDQFENLVGMQFDSIIRQFLVFRQSHDTLTARSMSEFFEKLFVSGVREIELTNASSISEWLHTTNPKLQTLITYYDNNDNADELYADLADVIMDKLFSFENMYVKKYVSRSFLSKEANAKLKQLFVSMCSYNITFLETSYIRPQHIFMSFFTSLTKDFIESEQTLRSIFLDIQEISHSSTTRVDTTTTLATFDRTHTNGSVGTFVDIGVDEDFITNTEVQVLVRDLDVINIDVENKTTVLPTSDLSLDINITALRGNHND